MVGRSAGKSHEQSKYLYWVELILRSKKGDRTPFTIVSRKIYEYF